MTFNCLLQSDSVMGPYISGRRAAMRSNSHCLGTRTTPPWRIHCFLCMRHV